MLTVSDTSGFTVGDYVDSGSGTLSDYSYYLNSDAAVAPSMPSWWDIPQTLPIAVPPHSRTTEKFNPAKARWNRGGEVAYAPPSLARQPQSQEVASGSSVAFEVEAYGTPVAEYQWYRNGVALSGQQNATLAIAKCRMFHAGDYRCLISDPQGEVWSAIATLAVYPSGPEPTVIMVQ